MNVKDLRKQFMQQGLRHNKLNVDPFKQFEDWYGEINKSDIREPGAMSLATVNADGQPRQRIVLLKLFDKKGFVFFTNYESRKANQIAVNSSVSLLFPWHDLGRQMIVTGYAEKVSTVESLNYFVTRPRGSQLDAWSSVQSEMINSRSILESVVSSMKEKYANKEVPLPPFWGGYRVRPESFEFWQEGENRLHDRFIYQRNEAGRWYSQRLAP